MSLLLWPAIDLRAGRVVRLLHGDPAQETAYDVPAGEVARRFEAEGADGLHVVDLDAAFGTSDNRERIFSILASVSIPVEVGGGLRSRADVAGVLSRGASRAVLGSMPFADPPLFSELLAEFGPRLVVALDCRDGRPTIRGWKQLAESEDGASPTAVSAARRLRDQGVGALLVTDVARDGAMTGPNLSLLRDVRAVFSGEVLASGGIRGVEDLEPVAGALSGGPAGAVLGRSVHSGHVTVARLREFLDAREARSGREERRVFV